MSGTERFSFSAGRNAWPLLVLTGPFVRVFASQHTAKRGYSLEASEVVYVRLFRPLPAVYPGRINSAPRGARSVRGDFLSRLFLSRTLRRMA